MPKRNFTCIHLREYTCSHLTTLFKSDVRTTHGASNKNNKYQTQTENMWEQFSNKSSLWFYFIYIIYLKPCLSYSHPQMPSFLNAQFKPSRQFPDCHIFFWLILWIGHKNSRWPPNATQYFNCHEFLQVNILWIWIIPNYCHLRLISSIF